MLADDCDCFPTEVAWVVDELNSPPRPLDMRPPAVHAHSHTSRPDLPEMGTLQNLTQKIQRKLRRLYQRYIGSRWSRSGKAPAVWGVSYSVFDGEELLEYSLRSIREATDYINVVYQTKSWYGEPCADDLLDVLHQCQAAGLIDELIEFVPDLSKTPRTLELEKRSLGLQHAIRAGCTYFMTLDCDELFIPSELVAAKEFIVEHGITTSYIVEVKYSYTPRHRQLDHGGCIAFFSAIDRDSVLGRNDWQAPYFVDSTRKISPPAYAARYHVLGKMIRVHHMELVRKDLQRKTKNSSWNEGGGTWELPPPGPDENEKVLTGSYVIVEDRFNIRFCQ